MKYYIWIIGCQYNEWDGARIRYFLDMLGLSETSAKNADLIIILACAVRQTAVDRIFGKLNNWKGKKIIITGCLLEPDKKKFNERGAIFVDSGDIKTLFETLTSLLKSNFSNFNLADFNKFIQNQNSQSMYVPITIGCNNFCSYCAVPYTRGREKSRPMDEIIDDIKKLIEKGHKEIMLLGQNVNSYRIKDSELRIQPNRKKSDFAFLLEKLSDLDGDFEISFTSNHPKDMSDDIINAVAKLPKIKRQIHLPLQSGSDKILKAMNRPYTKKEYLNIVQKIKTANSNIQITTDVIVGFPGETEKDFLDTVSVFKKVDYEVAYINKYSPRAGTDAYKLGDPIPWAEKQKRWRILNDLVRHNPKISKKD